MRTNRVPARVSGIVGSGARLLMALGTGLAPNAPVNCVVGCSASGPTSFDQRCDLPKWTVHPGKETAEPSFHPQVQGSSPWRPTSAVRLPARALRFGILGTRDAIRQGLGPEQVARIKTIVAPLFGRNLTRLGRWYGTNKASEKQAFTHVYEHHLRHRRREPLRILEIGIGGYNGGLRSGARR